MHKEKVEKNTIVNQFGVIPFEVNFKYNANDTENIKFNNENPKKISERT